MLTDMRNLPFSKNMALLQSAGVIDPSTQTSDPRALAQIAGGNVPAGMMSGWQQPTTEDRLAVLSNYHPQEALKLAVGSENVDKRVQGQIDVANERSRAMLEAIKERYEGSLKLLNDRLDYYQKRDAEKRDKPEKETEFDKLYNDYKEQYATEKKQGMHQGREMLSRFEFRAYLKKQDANASATGKGDAEVEKLKKLRQELLDKSYASAGDVKKDFEKGKLTREEATGILQRRFGYDE